MHAASTHEPILIGDMLIVRNRLIHLKNRPISPCATAAWKVPNSKMIIPVPAINGIGASNAPYFAILK